MPSTFIYIGENLKDYRLMYGFVLVTSEPESSLIFFSENLSFILIYALSIVK